MKVCWRGAERWHSPRFDLFEVFHLFELWAALKPLRHTACELWAWKRNYLFLVRIPSKTFKSQLMNKYQLSKFTHLLYFLFQTSFWGFIHRRRKPLTHLKYKTLIPDFQKQRNHQNRPAGNLKRRRKGNIKSWVNRKISSPIIQVLQEVRTMLNYCLFLLNHMSDSDILSLLGADKMWSVWFCGPF